LNKTGMGWRMSASVAEAIVAMAACLLGHTTATSPPHLAVVYERKQWVSQVQEALTSEWDLVPWAPDLNDSVLQRAEAVVGMVPDELLPKLPNLKLFQSQGYVTPLEDRAGSSERVIPTGVHVCRGGMGPAAAQYARTIAEWVLGATLDLMLRLRQTDALMRQCAWSEPTGPPPPECPPSSTFSTRPALMNSTLGIVGYGRVGAAVATLAAPLFGRVVASSPTATGPAPAPLTWWSQSNDDVLRSADALVFSFADHINATIGLINRTSYRLVKRGAVAVLFVGGAGVDEDATYDAVADGTLSGVAINQWWSRYSWRSPRPPGAQWVPPSARNFAALGDAVLMSPNGCEKSDVYWAGCATEVAHNLDATAAGLYPCAMDSLEV